MVQGYCDALYKKSHARFRLVPKSSTLDDLERPIRTLLQKYAFFGAHHKNLNDDRPIILLAVKLVSDSSVWQYILYVL